MLELFVAATMAERSPVENRGTVEAVYENKLIDIDCDAENGNSSRERSPQDNTDKAPPLTPNTPRSTESPSLKDINEGKYIYQANLHRASLCSRRKTEKENTHSTQNGRDENIKDKNIDVATENKEHLEGIASDSLEKEEGNYEELVCLVRQFYVERPVNPAAIAYQNIETC